MEILEYASCSDKNNFLRQIERYEWKAAKYLATLLKENRLQDALVGWSDLYLFVEKKKLVSLLTLSESDCISAPKRRLGANSRIYPKNL